MHSEHTHDLSGTSRLARLQQYLVALWLLALVGWLSLTPHVPASWLLAGLAVLTGGHAMVLAVELLLMRLVSAEDPAPRPSVAHLWRAWRQEVWLALRVFAWQQPFRWRNLPDTASHACTGPQAVVLVHGFVCNRGFWLPWLDQLRRRSIPYVTVSLEPVFGSIDDYVGQIEAAVQRAEKHSDLPPVLVGHSMGGLAIRAWLVSNGGHARIDRVVTIGSPHAGTWLARWSRVQNGRQMCPGGDWLRALAQRESAWRPERTYEMFTCWYSNTDNIVFPVSAATLRGADNRLLPGAPHVGLAFEPEVLADVLARLSAKNPDRGSGL